MNRVFALGVCVFLQGVLWAQSGESSGTIAGKVSDVSGGPIPNASVSVRGEFGNMSRSAATDAEGKFSTAGLPAGLYTVEVSAPSFTATRRTGVKLAAGSTETVNISLNVAELAQSITVEGTVSVAAETAPSQNTLDAFSARSEINPDFIQNFASPTLLQKRGVGRAQVPEWPPFREPRAAMAVKTVS